MPKVKVVIDTCVFVVAGMSKNANYAHTVIQKGLVGKIEIYACKETLDEIQNVFARPKFAGLLDTTEAQKLLHDYLQKVTVIDLKQSFLDKVGTACKDPKDAPFLALADQCQCHFLTSLDKKHLLSVVDYQGVKIIKPMELSLFLETSDDDYLE